jgi:hypothetical protein
MQNLIRPAAIIVALGLAVGACAQSGRALDQKTREPIVGARITLDCRRGKNVEGTETIRAVTRITDATGLYSFSAAELDGCQFMLLHGEQAGYHNVGSNDPADYMGRKVPTIEYFLEDSLWVRMELERSVALAVASPASLHVGENPRVTYDRWFANFAQAKRIATAPQDLAYVRDQYCAMLIATYAKLTAADKASMLRLRSQHMEDGKMVDVRTTDHDAQVLPYCAAP